MKIIRYQFVFNLLLAQVSLFSDDQDHSAKNKKLIPLLWSAQLDRLGKVSSTEKKERKGEPGAMTHYVNIVQSVCVSKF